MHEQSSKVTHCAGRVSAIARPHQHSVHLFDTQKVDLTPANYKYICNSCVSQIGFGHLPLYAGHLSGGAGEHSGNPH